MPIYLIIFLCAAFFSIIPVFVYLLIKKPQPKKMFLMYVICLIICYPILFLTNNPIHNMALELWHKIRLSEVTDMVSQIKEGTTRAEAEKILKIKDGGITLSRENLNTTRYFEPPDIMIDIYYDNTQGSYQPENKVIGPIKIYRGGRAAD